MNIDVIRERALLFGTIILSILLSIYGGKLAANEQYGTLSLMMVAGAVVFITLVAQERVWMGVLICWPLYGRLTVLPLPFSWRELGTLLTAGIFVVLIAIRVVRIRPKFSWLDGLLWLNVLWLVFAFIRNPTGTAATNSERVGGRPYLECFVALIGYLVLSRACSNYKSVRRMPWYVFGGVFLIFLVNIILIFVPKLGPLLFQVYNALDVASADTALVASPEDAEFRRYEFFRDLGRYGVTALCAYYVPTTLLSPLYAGRFFAFVGLMIGLLLSGFRSFIMYSGGMFILGNYFYRGWSSAVKAVTLGAVAVFLVMLGHGTLYQLPFAAQRALAFVPKSLRVTKLDQIAVDAGTSSTEWRVEMWIDALTTNLYITDKVYGDGFGVTKQQAGEATRLMVSGDYRTYQKIVAMYGDFHSGPVSTIRVAGYIGLGLMTLSLLLVARRAIQMVNSTRGTPLFQPALYIALPLVFEPFWFFFVYGGYTSGFFTITLGLGGIKMIENSLERWRAEYGEGAEQAPDLAPISADLPELETTPALRV